MECGQLYLDTVDAVDAINEEDEDENERDLYIHIRLDLMLPSPCSYLHAIL